MGWLRDDADLAVRADLLRAWIGAVDNPLAEPRISGQVRRSALRTNDPPEAMARRPADSTGK